VSNREFDRSEVQWGALEMDYLLKNGKKIKGEVDLSGLVNQKSRDPSEPLLPALTKWQRC